jgi:hypothetical protein
VTGLRSLAAAVEPALPSLLFLSSLLFLLARRGSRGARARWLRRREARAGRTLGRLGPPLGMLAFLLPVLSLEAGAPSSRIPAAATLFGQVPWLDAHGHLEGATRLIAQQRLNRFTERRPFNSPWLALRLRLLGLSGALWVQALLLGLAAFGLAHALGVRAGLPAGLACFALLYGLNRDYVGTVVAEPLGATFACLGVAALQVCARRGDLSSYAAGLLLLELALRTRPGAQLLLAGVVAWGVLELCGKRLAVLGLSACVVLGGEGVTRGLLALYGSGDASFTSYPAYTLYGLATNTNYARAKQDFARELEELSEREAARRMYAAALRRIGERPGDLARALAGNLWRFAERLPANFGRVLSLRGVVARGPDWVRPEPRQARLDALLSAPLLLFCLASAARGLPRRRRRERRLWLFLLLGLLASVPFVYGDAGLRGLLVALPALACLLALGLAARTRPAPGSESWLVAGGLGFALAMTVLVFAAPPLIRLEQPLPPGLDPSAESLLDLRLGSALRVVPAEPAPGRALAMSDYQRRLGYARLPGSTLWRRRPPFVLVTALDRGSGTQRICFAPPDFLDAATPLRRARLRPLGGSHRDDAAPASGPCLVESWEPLAVGSRATLP